MCHTTKRKIGLRDKIDDQHSLFDLEVYVQSFIARKIKLKSTRLSIVALFSAVAISHPIRPTHRTRDGSAAPSALILPYHEAFAMYTFATTRLAPDELVRCLGEWRVIIADMTLFA